MKNLLVITLLFSSFGFGSAPYILDCVIDKKQSGLAMSNRDLKIKIFGSTNFPPRKGSLIEYNLAPLFITKITEDNFFAERRFQGDLGFKIVHKLQINKISPQFISYFYRDVNGELTETHRDSGNCKLR